MLRKLFPGTELFIIAGNGLMQRSETGTYPFKQNNNMWYLCGLNEPNSWLVMDEDNEYIVLPNRSSENILFEGSLDKASLARSAGVKRAVELADAWPELKAKILKAKSVGILEPGQELAPSREFYTNPAQRRLSAKIKRLNPKANLVAIDSGLATLRVVKQPSEVAAIQSAIDVSVRSFAQVHKNLSKFKTEHQIELALSAGFTGHGASGHAYAPIVAGGCRACTLHYCQNSQPLKTGELVLIDAGAEVANYASDITRTYSLGRPTPRQQAVYNAVLSIQAFALSKLKPDVQLRDYELAALKFAAGQLQALGLITTADLTEARRYYPHSTSHFLGLDVHDVGDYYAPLQAGMVLTVEPGIYIPQERIGIRLEDNVLLTKTGCQNLSQGLPKSLI